MGNSQREFVLGITALVWIALRGIGNTGEAAASRLVVASTVRTESFELTSKNGKCRVRLQVQEDGNLALSLADENGTMQTWFSVDADGRLVETVGV